MAGPVAGFTALEGKLLADGLPPLPTTRRRGMPQRVWQSRQPRGRPSSKDVPRDQAERTLAWCQRKDRRVVVRGERLAACVKACLAMAKIHSWIHK
jgi:hypothetical protein